MSKTLIEFTRRLEQRPWNQPGADKTWVLTALPQHAKFSSEVCAAKRADATAEGADASTMGDQDFMAALSQAFQESEEKPESSAEEGDSDEQSDDESDREDAEQAAMRPVEEVDGDKA